MTAGVSLDTALWDGFHCAADLSSRDLSDWLWSQSDDDHAARAVRSMSAQTQKEEA